MRVRWIGLTLALLAAGGVAGYAAAALRQPEPVTFTGPTPVTAVSPSYPAEPVEVLPDPADPALRPGLPLHRIRVGSPPFDLALPVPTGWVRSTPTAGEWRWYPPPGLVLNTYFLRVRLIGNQYQAVEAAVDNRVEALRNAVDVEDLHVESRTAEGFVADYVSEGYRRVTMERYVAAPGSDTAYAWVALVGRERDRAGMADLFDRVVAGVRT